LRRLAGIRRFHLFSRQGGAFPLFTRKRQAANAFMNGHALNAASFQEAFQAASCQASVNSRRSQAGAPLLDSKFSKTRRRFERHRELREISWIACAKSSI
jgi:hypothetical protein